MSQFSPVKFPKQTPPPAGPQWHADFCSRCGRWLDDAKPHDECAGYPHGMYCSQCGKLDHRGSYVCYPDPRRAPETP